MMHNKRFGRRAGMALARLGGVALLMFGAVSCDSFIEPDPEDVLAPENFYRTSSDAIAAVNSVYEQNKWTHWLAYWYMTDVASDDIIASPNFGSDGHRMAAYTTDATEWVFGDVWGNSYRTINRANAVLDRVPAITMDDALKARLLGEAHFLRALSYFNLVRFYGDVPLLEHEVTSLTNLEVARSPAAEIYALIEADLATAVGDLDADYSGPDEGRATSGAAQSLLAKVYLTQGKWTEAAAAAGTVINSGEYALLSTWRDNFRIATELENSESIFEVNYEGELDPGAGSVMMLFSLPAGFPGGDAYGLMQVMPSLKAMFASGDERGEHGTFMTSPYTDALGRTTTWGVPNGSAFAKYLDESDEQNMESRGWGAQSNNWVVLRYADVLLMYAEAVAEGGTATAGSAESRLNEVRTRAGIAAVSGLSSAALLDSVRVERRREFVFEGIRWFDLARWGILDAAIMAKTLEMQTVAPGETTVHGVPSNLFPVPQSELDINPNLTQNPGW